MADVVNHPQHYNTGRFEAIDVIEDWKLGFNDGNAVKYLSRHRHKGHPIDDLQKAFWYITRELVSTYGVSQDQLAKMVMTIKKEVKLSEHTK